MGNKNYSEMARIIVENVGGVDNIIECYHCMSRLRLRIKDLGKVNLSEIKELGFTNTVINGNQLQVIAGKEVYDLYDAVSAVVGKQASTGEVSETGEAKHEKLTPKKAFFAFFGGIAGCIQPYIPVLIGAGVLKGIYLILAEIGVLGSETYTYQLLTAVCDAPFYFFPIFVGFNCAKQFGGNPYLGGFLGAILVHPSFTALVDSGAALTFLGLPVRSVSYPSTVLPAFVAAYFMCFVEKFVVKHSPKSIRVIMEPFVTTLVMVPLTLWILAPIGDYCGIGLGYIVKAIYTVAGPFAPAILAAANPFFVITGTHLAVAPVAINTLITTGSESVLMPGGIIHNMNEGALSLAIGFKSKNAATKSTGFSSAFTAIVGGISEPSLFGFFSKYKSAMIALIAGQFTSGLYCGITHTGIYAFPGGGPAFLQLIAFMGGGSANFINAIIATALGMVVTFVIAFILYRDEAPNAAKG